jgi:uncharacterized protein (DUF302 family)
MSIRKTEIAASPAEAAELLKSVIEGEGMHIDCFIDHASVLREAGITPVTAYTLLFSSAKVSSRLLSKNSGIALDIPLRIAVVEEGGRTVAVYRDMHPLLSSYQGGEMVDVINIVNLLTDRIVQTAADRARRSSA